MVFLKEIVCNLQEKLAFQNELNWAECVHRAWGGLENSFNTKTAFSGFP